MGPKWCETGKNIRSDFGFVFWFQSGPQHGPNIDPKAAHKETKKTLQHAFVSKSRREALPEPKFDKKMTPSASGRFLE